VEAGMDLSTSKTKVAIFTKKETKSNPNQLRNERLEITQNYKYLGMEFNEKLNLEACTMK
jgi:hypothetical protein